VRGRWRSEQIAVEIGLEGMLATVYTREGERRPHKGEYNAELEHRADKYGMELECRATEIGRQAALGLMHTFDDADQASITLD